MPAAAETAQRAAVRARAEHGRSIFRPTHAAWVAEPAAGDRPTVAAAAVADSDNPLAFHGEPARPVPDVTLGERERYRPKGEASSPPSCTYRFMDI